MKKFCKENKKIIGLIFYSLFIVFVFSFLSFRNQVEATTYNSATTTYNNNTYDYNNNTYDYNNNSYSFSLSNITDSGLLSAVIGCTGITDKLETFLDKIFKPKTKTPDDKKDTSTDKVSTTDSDVKKSSADTAATTASDKKRNECFNGIAMYLAKKQLSDITEKTVNWIDSGYNGDAFFIKDQNSFYQSISDQTMQNLLSPISSDSTLYPYGKDVARSIILNARDNTKDQLKTSLSPQQRTDYNQSFLNGGWDQWLNVTQNPANNPLGFSAMTSNYVSNGQDQAINTQKAELDQNGGFLSQKKCTVYDNSEAGKKISGDDKGVCKKWETVTPGSVIADKLKFTLNSPERQLEAANDINSSLSKIFSALLDSLVNEGLSSLSTNSYTTTTDNSQSSGPGTNKTYYDTSGQDASASGVIIQVNKGNGGWYTADGGGFDLTTNLGDYCIGKDPQEGIIATQRDYMQAIKDSKDKLSGIMPALGALDFCIPGPNPNWETTTQLRIEGMINFYNDIYVTGDGQKIWTVVPNIDDYTNNDSDKPWLNLNSPNVNADVGAAKTGGEAGYNKAIEYAGYDMTGTSAQLISLVKSIVCALKKGGCKSDAQLRAEQQALYNQTFANMQTQLASDTQNRIDTLNNTFKDYKRIIDLSYGYDSPMLKEDYYGYDDNGDMRPNPYYLPMGISGLELTKNIGVYAMNVHDSSVEYDNLIQETTSNLYQLKLIKNRVDVIKNKVITRQFGKNYSDRSKVPQSCVPYKINTDRNGNPILNSDRKETCVPYSTGTCKITSFTNGGYYNTAALTTPNKLGDPISLLWKTSGCGALDISKSSASMKISGDSSSIVVTPRDDAVPGRKYAKYILNGLSSDSEMPETSKTLYVNLDPTVMIDSSSGDVTARIDSNKSGGNSN